MTANIELFVALVSSFQQLTNFTKNLNIGAMGFLNPPLASRILYPILKFVQVIKLSIVELQPATFVKIVYFSN